MLTIREFAFVVNEVLWAIWPGAGYCGPGLLSEEQGVAICGPPCASGGADETGIAAE